MARLNTNLPPSSQPSRATTADSLYRDPTPHLSARTNAPRTARQSSYSVMSPSESISSDKENRVPESRENTPRPVAKTRQPMASGAARLPTPNSGSSSAGGRNKRRRTDEYSIADSTPVFQDEDEDEDASVPVHEDESEVNATPGVDGEDEDTKFYDPQQDPDLRRQIRANIRKHHREIEDNRDELIKPGNGLLLQHLKRQDYYMKKVRQTADAALDSRVMVLASDLAGKKLNNSLHGNNGVGIDVDQFVSKCIFFMKNGGSTVDSDNEGATSTQARNRRRTAYDEEDEEEEIGDGLDWALLGREACFPSNKRPPVSSFLLGPLSVQKRIRATQNRRARSQRQPVGPATRPQELTDSDIKQSENSNLTHLVTGIKSRLEQHITSGEEKIEAELTELGDDVDDEGIEAACRRHRVYQTSEQEAAASLFDFVINPKSFGQTVENLFYVSFLIREGNAKVLHDQHGLPLLVPSKPHTIEEQRERHIQKHQAVFSLDWPTWQSLIEAFDIKDPLIPHRVAEETNITAGGWYG